MNERDELKFLIPAESAPKPLTPGQGAKESAKSD